MSPGANPAPVNVTVAPGAYVCLSLERLGASGGATRCVAKAADALLEPAVAVAVKPAASDPGSANDSDIDPSAAALTSALYDHGSERSSSTATCTVSPAGQPAPLSTTVSPGA